MLQRLGIVVLLMAFSSPSTAFEILEKGSKYVGETPEEDSYKCYDEDKEECFVSSSATVEVLNSIGEFRYEVLSVKAAYLADSNGGRYYYEREAQSYIRSKLRYGYREAFYSDLQVPELRANEVKEQDLVQGLLILFKAPPGVLVPDYKLEELTYDHLQEISNSAKIKAVQKTDQAPVIISFNKEGLLLVNGVYNVFPPSIKNFRPGGVYEKACYEGSERDVHKLIESLIQNADGDGESRAELNSVKNLASESLEVSVSITDAEGVRDETFNFGACE